MKILAIRGKNLASLAGDFVVDFEQEPLKSAGLFAISGPTGAGKSTLLDALCMALYESTPRLLKAGGNKTLPDGSDFITHQDAANLLRRGSAEGHAEVDFVGNDGASYRARWSVRRSRGKISGSLQPTAMSLKSLPDLQPIGGTNREVKAEIIRRIGLSFEQFTRAVLLAQNEFSSFLKADDSERGELLETLTGSAIYSQLSQRAFARAKLEQQELQRINDRLADQKPLSESERTQLALDSAAANASVTALDQRKAELESQLRWYQDDDKLAQSVQLAEQQCQHRQAEQEQAANRSSALQQVEAVQPARPLLAETERLARSISQQHGAISEASAKLASAAQAQADSQSAVTSAQASLQHAEQAQIKAAPTLDLAKALDASIATLLPTHQAAQQAQRAADLAASQAQEKHHDKQTELQLSQQKQLNTEQWLTQHSALQKLAENWPAWDILLRQATHTRNEHAGLTDILAKNSQNEASQTEQLQQHQLALTTSASALHAAEQQRQQAGQHYADVSGQLSQLPASKQALDQRREQLASAEQIARTLGEQSARQHALSTQAATSLQAIGQFDAAALAASTQLPALNAALAQAEHALKQAEAACADTVESLRATLEPDAPCPVCGAQEHPYRSDDNPQLRAVLASLQQQVAACRQHSQQAQQTHSINSTEAASQRRQCADLQTELELVQRQLQAQQLAWQAHPLRTELNELNTLVAAQQDAWFSSQRAAVQAQLAQIAALEAASHAALQNKDGAQATYERATQDHAHKKADLDAASTALLQTKAAQLNASQQAQQSQQRLHASLDELAPAFRAPFGNADADDTGLSDWRSSWQADPEAFHRQCEQHARRWLNQSKEREQNGQRLATLSLELNNLSEAHNKAALEQQRASQEFAASEQTIKGKQAQRLALLQELHHAFTAPDQSGLAALGDAPELSQIEAQFSRAIASARQQLAQHTQAASDAAQAHSRSIEALAQAKTRLANDQLEADKAAQRLDDWISQHFAASAQPGDEVNAESEIKSNSATLRDLLSHSADWISQERAALQAIANANHKAITVLQERSQQRQAHQAQRPPAQTATSEEESAAASASNPLEALQQALATLAATRQSANASATQLQASIAQDQARRSQSAELILSMEAQEARYQLWGTLNELIGSADGKKFRNYAQQTTLDLLLGYANRHLHELSRRYRLQRINDTLALMVIDQDMGDEARSVHSLSGGESFLVSLALALGLASLSSNRVRVESLFIDEGFGSLDADTLRVAMDALDGLQAMGRKVGVISHVQEMTERISTKILVQRTSGGRSLVGVG